jgi:Holliday junction resolvasome RuvABC endonuclease subunit
MEREQPRLAAAAVTSPTVLGFDPGPTSTGWALIRPIFERRERPRFLQGGSVPSTLEDLAGILRSLSPEAVAVEAPEGYVHEHERGAQLIETSRVAGEIIGVCHALRIPCSRMSASHVRARLCRRPSANDRTVKTALTVFMCDLPKKSNSHVRDAAAVALVSSWSSPRSFS